MPCFKFFIINCISRLNLDQNNLIFYNKMWFIRMTLFGGIVAEVSPWTNPQEWDRKLLRSRDELPPAGLSPDDRITIRDTQAVNRVSTFRASAQLPMLIGIWPHVDAITEVILRPSPGTAADAWALACLRARYTPCSTLTHWPTECARFIHVWNQVSALARGDVNQD